MYVYRYTSGTVGSVPDHNSDRVSLCKKANHHIFDGGKLCLQFIKHVYEVQ